MPRRRKKVCDLSEESEQLPTTRNTFRAKKRTVVSSDLLHSSPDSGTQDSDKEQRFRHKPSKQRDDFVYAVLKRKSRKPNPTETTDSISSYSGKLMAGSATDSGLGSSHEDDKNCDFSTSTESHGETCSELAEKLKSFHLVESFCTKWNIRFDQSVFKTPVNMDFPRAKDFEFAKRILRLAYFDLGTQRFAFLVNADWLCGIEKVILLLFREGIQSPDTNVQNDNHLKCCLRILSKLTDEMHQVNTIVEKMILNLLVTEITKTTENQRQGIIVHLSSLCRHSPFLSMQILKSEVPALEELLRQSTSRYDYAQNRRMIFFHSALILDLIKFSPNTLHNDIRQICDCLRHLSIDNVLLRLTRAEILKMVESKNCTP